MSQAAGPAASVLSLASVGFTVAGDEMKVRANRRPIPARPRRWSAPRDAKRFDL
jgi:hypothetical protein